MRGALQRVPLSASLFLAGFLAITGSPPFGPFVSEFTIIRGTVQTGHFAVAVAFLLLMAIVFIGMGVTVLAVVQGEPPAEEPGITYRDRFSTVAPIALFMALVLLLGLYIPPPLDALLRDAAATLEGTT